MTPDAQDFLTGVARRLKETRKRLGYTQARLAERADISFQYIAELENGRKSMSIVTLARLAQALSVSTDYLLWGTEAGGLRLLEARMSAIPRDCEQDALALLTVFLDIVQRRSTHTNG